MDERLLQTMLDVDEHHWWYRGRRRIIRTELERLPLAQGARILDAGCGSGRTLEELVAYGEVYGIELSPAAAEVARGRGCGEVQVGTLEELPWEPESFDLITCLDVLEHLPDDRLALGELRRVCKPGGWLVATVPAYQSLWSYHDEANHHYRRYERATFRAAAVDSGWRVERMTAFNSLLFGPAAIVRLAQRRRRNGGQEFDLNLGPSWLNNVLERPLRLEARWLARGRTLPAGLSLMAVLQKPSGLSRTLALAAIISVSSKLGYVLPAIIGLESMGIPSPGETALVAAAILASQGKLHIWLVILIGVCSAILGDNIGYVLGRVFGRDVLEARGPFRAHRKRAIVAGDRFFSKHGPKAVFVARWIALVRFAAAWLAGINRMPFRQFFFWNALGGISWGVTFGLAGYYGGHAATGAFATAGIVGAAILALAFVGLLIYFGLRERRQAAAEEHGAAEQSE